ncbi:hypothetical protein CDL60_16000 [Roseateles noduli]|nr:hypothetical protein CDL60_16000 [Roseateles noduli]
MDYPLQTPQQLAGHLRALRRASGLSQKEIGERIGVGQSRITRIERDPLLVNFQQLQDYLNALGVQLVLRTPDALERPVLPPSVATTPRPSTEEPW